MKRIVNIVTYVAAVVGAIAKGFVAMHEHWPADNPFKTNQVGNGNTAN